MAHAEKRGTLVSIDGEVSSIPTLAAVNGTAGDAALESGFAIPVSTAASAASIGGQLAAASPAAGSGPEYQTWVRW